MDNKLITASLKDLTDLLEKCSDRYYNDNKNLNKEYDISDSEYDKLFDKLTELEMKQGYSLPSSPTKNVGYTVLNLLPKHIHKTPLLSLNKTKLVDDIVKFANGKVLIAMLKLDGLTVELEYNNGILVKGSTRGNGEVGSDITFHIYKFKNVPIHIKHKGLLRISGEAIIHQEDFDRINEPLANDDKYKTRRNLASGTLGSLDNKITEERCLYFYAYNILESNSNRPFKSIELDDLKDFGFTVVMWQYITHTNNVQVEINYLQKEALTLGIPIDGIVFSQNDLKYGESLGSTSHHPLHSIAFKFKDDAIETTLLSVEWSPSRTGLLNPVAIFEPVEIDGTTVTRASLSNISIMEDLELGIGDTITTSKRNMIIPKVEDNLTRSNTVVIPTKCPVCGAKTAIIQDNDSKVLYCTDIDCKAKLLGKLVHFCDKNSMDIQGVSESTLQKFIDLGWITNLYELYTLYKHKQEIVNMSGFGIKSFTNITESIEKSKSVKVENFIRALGIPNIGRSQSKELSKRFDEDWYKFNKAMDEEYDFTQIEGFGDTLNNNIHNWYKSWKWSYDRQLTPIMNFIKPTIKADNIKSLAGLTFVITGSVTHFKNRDELKAKIESMDGKVAGSVSNKTNYLINNDSTSSTGKNKTAKELSIPIITEDQFLEMIK